ncbi:DUF2500 domain-containing protein [Pontibacillus marinus]|uniref:DUF2500 domain-containing protein n=1 Tax=Pontibacillus marinus BH030004 = DSM 16465 TaxID=1385511 RepID=A0A0A5FU08_9BACI|nr:DUF2500 domain-containing protein [Pontibacillus marinus]KGX84271.1 hypothetical protein N783_18035 [Pontibacillus marinus BH030004 = DSM 16465]
MGIQGPGPGFGLFSIVPYFIGAVFMIIVIIFIVTAVKGIKQWSYNNKQPVLTVNAKVISKRTQVRGRNNDNMNSTRTYYFVTFEVESGDRMELQIDGQEFGMLAEDDVGSLTFQGTRYKGFERM